MLQTTKRLGSFYYKRHPKSLNDIDFVKIQLYETLIILKAMAATITMEAIIKAMEEHIKKKYTHWAIIIVKKAIVVLTGTAPKNL